MSEQTPVQAPTEPAGDVPQQGTTKTVLGTPLESTKVETPAAPAKVEQTEAEVKAAAEAKVKADADAAAKAVPEKYDFKLPDGVALDQATADVFTPKFKELGLTQTQAQALVDTYVASMKASTTANEAAFAQQEKDWLAASKADTEIGGQKFEENSKLAQKTMSAMGSPELVQLMETTGFGNHPEVIRFFSRVGKHLSEDALVRPGGAGAGPRSLEERLYGGTSQRAQ